jgi:hypothetical protein
MRISRIGSMGAVLAVMLAGPVAAQDLYLVSGDALLHVGEEGSSELTSGWSGCELLAVCGDMLYAVHEDTLYCVDPASGERAALGEGWAGARALVGGGDVLYALRGAELLAVDPESGEAACLSDQCSEGQLLAWAMDCMLMLVQDDTLYAFDLETCEPTLVAYAWNGVTGAAGSELCLYGVQRDTLYEVNPLDGEYESVGVGYAGISEIVVLGEAIFYVKGSELYAMSVLEHEPECLIEGLEPCTAMAGRP